MKAGIVTLALPGALHGFGYVASRLQTAGHGFFAGVRRALAPGGPPLLEAGAIAVLLAGLLAPLLLPPRPVHERRWHVPLAIATALTGLFVFALVWRFDVIQASALYGLRLELPPLTTVAGLAHVLAFFGWTFATIELIADRGGIRLAGYGMVLLALGGYEQASPVELCLSVLGLVAVAVGELRALPYADRNVPRIGDSEWRGFVGRLAAGVGDGTGPDGTRPEAVVVAEGELEVSRIQTHRRGQPVTIKLKRKRGTPVELDASYGNAGHAAADASIERHRRWLERNPEQKLRLPRTKTGDASFDQKFSVHGTAPLADTEMRRRLERQQGDGVLTIWRGSAARYQLSHPSSDVPAAFIGQVDGAAPVQSIVDIVDMLADLVDASMPIPSSSCDELREQPPRSADGGGGARASAAARCPCRERSWSWNDWDAPAGPRARGAGGAPRARPPRRARRRGISCTRRSPAPCRPQIGRPRRRRTALAGSWGSC